jgi:hypothetical protein
MGGSLSKKDESTVLQSRGYIAALRAFYLFKVNSERFDLIAARIQLKKRIRLAGVKRGICPLYKS